MGGGGAVWSLRGPLHTAWQDPMLPVPMTLLAYGYTNTYTVADRFSSPPAMGGGGGGGGGAGGAPARLPLTTPS